MRGGGGGIPRAVREPPGGAGAPVAVGWRRWRRCDGGDRCPPARRSAALWAKRGKAQGGFSGGKKRRKRPNPPSGERPGRTPPVNPFRAPGRRGQGAGRRVLGAGWDGANPEWEQTPGGGGEPFLGGRGAAGPFAARFGRKTGLKRGLFSLSVRFFRLSQGTAGLKLLIRFSKFVPWQREPDSRGTVTQEPPRPRLSSTPGRGGHAEEGGTRMPLCWSGDEGLGRTAAACLSFPMHKAGPCSQSPFQPSLALLGGEWECGWGVGGTAEASPPPAAASRWVRSECTCCWWPGGT